MHVRFSLTENWPVLAWLAHCPRGSEEISVRHGRQVEIHGDWFAEATWAGDFAAGDFDQTDLVFGSGGRLRGSVLRLISAGSGEDRLLVHESDTSVHVSNSLPCLLAALDAEIDCTWKHYHADLSTISKGLSRYKQTMATSRGDIRLVYYNNLLWDGQQLSVESKPGGDEHFDCYQDYYDYLATSLASIVANLSDSRRQTHYGMIGTLSRGYDSTAVTALTVPLGCREVLTFQRSRGGEDDSGEALRHYLDVELIRVNRDDWRDEAGPSEIPFLIGDAMGQDLHFKAAEKYLRNRVIFTGFPGAHWQMNPKDLSGELVRSDCAGLSLTEYRLSIGLLHCPVGYFGARQCAAINRINHSVEMRPWDVGGNYTKPICRRIVEEVGVPRELFGQKKMATAVLDVSSSEFLTPDSMKDFIAWLSQHRPDWWHRGKLPPFLFVDSLIGATLNLTQHSAISLSHTLARTPGGWRFSNIRGLWHLTNLSDWMPPIYLRRYVFAWAVDRYKKIYTR